MTQPPCTRTQLLKVPPPPNRATSEVQLLAHEHLEDRIIPYSNKYLQNYFVELLTPSVIVFGDSTVNEVIEVK